MGSGHLRDPFHRIIECDNTCIKALLYYISAEALRPSLSVFGPTSRRFWLPEQPGSYPEQGGACPERSGSDQEAIREHAGAIREHTLITQADMGSNKTRKAKPAFSSHKT